MNISSHAEKAFDKIQHMFMIKVLERSGIQGTYLNIIKATYRKLNQITANIKLNERKLEVISLKSGTRQDCPFSLYLFSIVLEILTRAIIKLKKSKGIQIGNEKVKILLFADNMIVHMSPINSTREFLQLINPSSKVTRYKLTQKPKETTNNKRKYKSNITNKNSSPPIKK